MKYARLISAALICAVSAWAASGQGMEAAREAARKGEADISIASLRTVLSADPKNADAHALSCELYGSIDRFDDAVRECEAASKAAPNSSAISLSLAAAYGNKASHSGSLTGMRMIGRLREAFERAVQLDGKSVNALSDLGQFYVEAPGIVGGGLDKARALLPRLRAVSPVRAHRLAGMIASKAGDEATAEAEFNSELALSHSPEAYVDLANFERKRKHFDTAAANARLAIEKDGARGGDTIDAVGILLEMKRDVPFAQESLRRYIATLHTSAVTPLARVHTTLGESLAGTGDKVGARREFEAALALAKDYAPARKALGQ